jgi:hypothetical protein
LASRHCCGSFFGFKGSFEDFFDFIGIVASLAFYAVLWVFLWLSRQCCGFFFGFLCGVADVSLTFWAVLRISVKVKSRILIRVEVESRELHEAMKPWRV